MNGRRERGRETADRLKYSWLLNMLTDRISLWEGELTLLVLSVLPFSDRARVYAAEYRRIKKSTSVSRQGTYVQVYSECLPTVNEENKDDE